MFLRIYVNVVAGDISESRLILRHERQRHKGVRSKKGYQQNTRYRINRVAFIGKHANYTFYLGLRAVLSAVCLRIPYVYTSPHSPSIAIKINPNPVSLFFFFFLVCEGTANMSGTPVHPEPDRLLARIQPFFGSRLHYILFAFSLFNSLLSLPITLYTYSVTT